MTERPTEVTVAGYICLEMIPVIRQLPGDLSQLLVPGKPIDAAEAVKLMGGAVPETGLALHRLGFRTQLVGKVAAGTNDTFMADEIAESALLGSRLFHFGYPPLMRSMYEGHGEQLERLFRRAKKAGLATSLDLAKPAPESAAGKAEWLRILARTMPHVDFALSSLDDIWHMLDRAGCEAQLQRHGGREAAATASPAQIARLAERLLVCGAAGVVIKLGERGIYLRTAEDAARWSDAGACRPADIEVWRGRELWAPCFHVEATATAGAGGCANAGFLGAVLRGMTPGQAIAAAITVGACNGEMPDALSGVPLWEHIWRRIRSGSPQRGIDLAADGWTPFPAGSSGVWIGPNDRMQRRF